jgi:hypothetical protein
MKQRSGKRKIILYLGVVMGLAVEVISVLTYKLFFANSSTIENQWIAGFTVWFKKSFKMASSGDISSVLNLSILSGAIAGFIIAYKIYTHERNKTDTLVQSFLIPIYTTVILCLAPVLLSGIVGGGFTSLADSSMWTLVLLLPIMGGIYSVLQAPLWIAGGQLLWYLNEGFKAGRY